MTKPDQSPFIHEIRVTWGDCDPAKIAYTARLPWFALDAINAWWEDHLGGDGWFQMELDRNMGTPFVHMSLDFTSPVTPRHRLMCQVDPLKLGTTSITFRVIGRQDGVDCFTGRFVCVFTQADTFTKRPAPQEIVDIVTPLLVSPDAG
ncbi:acyl-CoA thioesterase [Thalassobius vesicularis]|uniref:Acyl-CoA thioesterase n=1 Tax=Thalassobius vesicularis TaxID=1294297 RepID=A0A4S3MCZ1_9RHOB|nr:thioesterase family protein [Thalassobius vesicularis]THD76550.1 acyl-CoA thioesterase [Thalassobius vesicularis]